MGSRFAGGYIRASSARKLATYFLIPAVGVASPVLAIPAITSHFGSQGWAHFVLGQSIGAAVSVAVELGWGLNGPRLAARSATRDLMHLYEIATASKLAIWLFLAAPVSIVSGLLVPAGSLVVTASSLAGASAGLSPAWFFMGTGQPGRIVMTDAIPRLLGIVAGSVVLETGGPLTALPGLMIASSFVSIYIGRLLVVKPQEGASGTSLRTVSKALRDQGWAFSGRAVGAIYIALPVTIVSMVTPQFVASYAAVDRLMRMVLQVLQGLPNAMQRWLNSAKGEGEWRQRLRLCLTINVLFGLCAGACFASTARLAEKFIFSGVVHIDARACWVAGLIIALTCSSRSTGVLALASLAKMRSIFVSATAGAVVGFTLIILLTPLMGPVGAMLSLATAEAVVLAVQVLALCRHSSGEPPAVDSPPSLGSAQP